MEIREVTVADMLRARDARVERQAQMLKKHGVPLISFTMNIAGPVKMDGSSAHSGRVHSGSMRC